jgi:uncharacterized protein YegL
MTAPTDRIHASVLLDRSGSMSSMREQVITGFNTFVADQRTTASASAAALSVSLVQFDGQAPFDIVIAAVPALEMRDLEWDDYEPRGSTPLLDAIGRLVEWLDARIASAGADEEQTVYIITDGHENASTDFNYRKIRELIEARTAAGWTFLFLGANQDSFEVGRNIGVAKGNTRNFAASGDGASRVFDEMSGSISMQRGRSRQERSERRQSLFDERTSSDEVLGGTTPSAATKGGKGKQYFRPRPGESTEDLARRLRRSVDDQ